MFNGWGWDSTTPTSGTLPFKNGSGIWIRLSLYTTIADAVISSKDAVLYTSNDKGNSWSTK